MKFIIILSIIFIATILLAQTETLDVVENCAMCIDYNCEKISKLFKSVPQARKTLEEIRKNNF